jgi:DNA recombination protein RmuC
MLIALLILCSLLIIGVAFACAKINTLKSNNSQQEDLARQLLEKHHEQRAQFDKHCLSTNQGIQNSVTQQMSDLRQQIQGSLKQHQDAMATHFEQLTQVTRNKLQDISQQVDKTLTTGFEKTTATFQDVIKRLTIIDQAQQKISDLSSHVVNLQEILVDNRSRGAFGEVQLSALIGNMVPENHFSMQHTLSNGKRVDCLLLLPEPTGNIAVDAKFPLNTYRQMSQRDLPESERKTLLQQFKRDIKTHINDIADKYQITGETADGAIMFIPAEVVFAEIHGQHPDLVEYAHQKRVWLTSPTTMMAILTTARAVIKDEATRQQVHIIQKHLGMLGQDFDRFQKRMDQLARHINQAQQDVEQVHTSSKKISRRFSQIESVELTPADSLLDSPE